MSAERRVVLTLVLAAFLTRAGYVFLLTDYPAYLVSDMSGYWQRALHRFAGTSVGSAPWAVWPPLYHVLLADLFRLFDILAIPQRRWLEWALGAQILLGALAVGAVYLIGRDMLPRRAAVAVAVLYALTYPLVYLNAFVLSDNVAIPLLIGATLLVLRTREGVACPSLAGLALGVAVGIRPALGPLTLPFLAFLLLSRPRRRAALRAGFFTAGLVGVLAIVTHANASMSGGTLTGLGANGGLNFFIAQCKVHRVHSIRLEDGDRVQYDIRHPQFVHEPWRLSVWTDRPIHDQGYFYRWGLRCLRERPQELLADVWELRKLLWGPFFPTMYSARGFLLLEPTFTALLGLVSLTALGLAPLVWVRRPPAASLWMLWSLLPVTMATVYVFGVERRFALPLVHVYYLCVAAVIERHGPRVIR